MARKRTSSKPRVAKKAANRSTLTVAATPTEPAVPATARESYSVERWTNAHAPNAAMLRSVLAREGYTVYQWSDPPGTVYGMHRHDTRQSHWIISGEMELAVEGRGTFLLR